MNLGPLKNCPARLARFRLECVTLAPDDGSRSASMQTEPNVPLPCVESLDQRGRCLHCQQPMLRGAGEPHGPFCTSIDSGCRECRRLQREAASSASAAPAAPAPAPITSDDQPDAETLKAWRAEALSWRELESYPEFQDAARNALINSAQRVATLADALTETRAELARVKIVASDAIRRLGTFDSRTNELAGKIATLSTSVAELWGLVLGSRPVFSSRPVEIDPPNHRPDCQCPICTH